MTDDRKSGIALLAGSIGTLVTMAIHPQGSGDLTDAQYVHLASASAIAHTLAILSMTVFALGALGLTRRLTSRELRLHPTELDRLALAALAAYAVALVAILIAAAISGFIVPRIFIMMVRDNPADLPQWHITAAAIFQFNQAFSRIYSVGASAAIILWSASALRNGGLNRATSLYGCIIGSLITLLIFTGHLRLDVHGMTAVVLLQAIWFILAGTQLLRPSHNAGVAHACPALGA